MSAGFKVAGRVFWGTNGAVETYLEELATVASARFGPESRFARFFGYEREAFAMGRIVFLDAWLTDPVAREQLVELFEVATQQLLRDDAFSEYGQAWVAAVIPELQARIATGGAESP